MSGAAVTLRLAAAAIVVLVGCTSGGNAEAGSQAATASPSTRLSPGSPASSEPSPAASGPSTCPRWLAGSHSRTELRTSG